MGPFSGGFGWALPQLFRFFPFLWHFGTKPGLLCDYMGIFLLNLEGFPLYRHFCPKCAPGVGDFVPPCVTVGAGGFGTCGSGFGAYACDHGGAHSDKNPIGDFFLI